MTPPLRALTRPWRTSALRGSSWCGVRHPPYTPHTSSAARPAHPAHPPPPLHTPPLPGQLGPAPPVLTCSRYDTLYHAMCLLTAAGRSADRVVCVDAAGRCTGIVTASDIIAYFLRPEPVALRAVDLARFPASVQESAAAAAAAAALSESGVGMTLGDGGSM